MNKLIGVIGANDPHTTRDLNEFAYQVGHLLAEYSYTIISGGMGGTMQAVCKGAKASPCAFHNQTIGLIPGERKEEANSFVDVVIPTGIGSARNALILNSADLFIALGGGPGTLSELAYALQKGKKVLCLAGYGGWSERILLEDLVTDSDHLLYPIETIDQIRVHLI